MTGEAVGARLRQWSLLSQTAGPRTHQLDMSAAAITARLRVLGGLSDMCLRLGAVGRALRPESGAKSVGKDAGGGGGE
jgi:hypothetical protein